MHSLDTRLVDKFLKRIVTVDMDDSVHDEKNNEVTADQVYAYTHGINSDPITLLAIVFSGEAGAATIKNLHLFVMQCLTRARFSENSSSPYP
jgi:hypothetical protein